jgi:large repetitive protein
MPDRAWYRRRPREAQPGTGEKLKKLLVALLCGALAVSVLAIPTGASATGHAQIAKKCKKSKKAVAAKKKCKKKKAPAPTTVPPTTTTPTGPTPPPDADADGVPDSSDNCVSNSNPGQADTDADGKGDVCDFCPSTANPGAQGCPTSIYDINLGNVPNGTNVRLVDRVVTARMADSSALWLQMNSADTDYVDSGNAGLEVDLSGVTSLPSIAAGDRVTVDGIVGTQSLAATNVVVNNSGNSIDGYNITATDFVGGTFNTSFNGQVVHVTTAYSLSSRDGNGEWMTSAGFKVAKRIIGTLPACADGTSLSLFGIADLVSGNLVLLPTSTGDLGQPCMTDLNIPATACVGQTSLGSVTLSAPVPTGGGSMFVSLTSSDPTNVPVPSAVGVLEGQTTHTIGITPQGPANNVTITATLNGGQIQDTVSAINC